MFSYSLGVWGTSEKVYENLPFLTSSRIPQRTGCRKQTAAVTGSDPHSKSPPCCCVADAAPLGRSHIWVFLGLPQCPALKSHLCLGSSPQSGGLWTTPLQPPFLWLSPMAWPGQEVAGCDQPDNRAEVSKVGQCSEEGPRLELGGPLYPSPTTTLCGFSASLGLLLCRKLPRGLFRVWIKARLKRPVLPCTGGTPGGFSPAMRECLWGHLAQAALGPARNWGFSCLALYTE